MHSIIIFFIITSSLIKIWTPPSHTLILQTSKSWLSKDQYTPPPKLWNTPLPLISLLLGPHLLPRVILLPFIDHLHPLFGPFSLNINCLLNQINQNMYTSSQTQRNHNARLPSNLTLRHLHTYTTAKKAFNTFSNRGIQTVFLLYLNPLTTKHHIIDKYVPVLLLNIHFIVFCFILHILDKCINRSIVMATSFRSSYQSFDFFS